MSTTTFHNLQHYPASYQLLDDFDRIHPTVKNTLLNRWSIIKQHLINRLQSHKITNCHDKELAATLPRLAAGSY